MFRLLLFCLFFSQLALAESLKTQELQLYKVIELQNTTGLQPSGLAICGNNLLFISDKHDSQIFKIDINSKDAHKTVSVYNNLDNIPPASNPELPYFRRIKNWLVKLFNSDYLDWEGITCDGNNTLYLISESTLNILKISTDSLSWLTNDLYEAGSAAGLFVSNYAEGISWSPVENGFYVAAEREPRGILFAAFSGQKQLRVDRAIQVEKTTLAPPTEYKRSLDFTGLQFSNGFLYTLERNYSAVCRRDGSTLSNEQCWSYGDTENNEQNKYVNDRYGMAEGMAFDERFVYILLDNNNEARMSDKSNHHPTLFIFHLPENWNH